jgi:hypothetical protein
MKLVGHYYCETRPTYAQLAAVAERAEHAAKNACQDLREAVARSRAVPSYDVLAGLSRAVTVGEGKPERPNPEWRRGKCPACGDDIVFNCYRIDGGYLACWECWGSLATVPTCNYRKVL